MEKEAFFTTTAQVLPTLLLAFALEVALLTRLQVPKRQEDRSRFFARRLPWMLSFGSMIVTGEILALLGLLAGPEESDSDFAVYFCFVTLIAAMGIILALPLVRLEIDGLRDAEAKGKD